MSRKTSGLISTIYSHMTCFCARSCLFVVAMIAPALRFLVALIFKSRLVINPLTR